MVIKTVSDCNYFLGLLYNLNSHEQAKQTDQFCKVGAQVFEVMLLQPLGKTFKIES